jgi:cell shape-determining protein MreC
MYFFFDLPLSLNYLFFLFQISSFSEKDSISRPNSLDVLLNEIKTLKERRQELEQRRRRYEKLKEQHLKIMLDLYSSFLLCFYPLNFI